MGPARPVLDVRSRLAGALLGTAIGDALGLPFEGMSPRAVARRARGLDRFRLFGRTGFVSDDTEQAALLAASLARHPDSPEACVRTFRRALVGWLARLPWGIGGGTLRACVKIALGLRRSGVDSAGNGAAMRAAVVGVFFSGAPREQRWRFCDALAEVTHTDVRAVEGARFVAEVAATGDAEAALACVASPELAAALVRALELARDGRSTSEAVAVLGNSGFVVCSIPVAAFVFSRFGDDPTRAIREAVLAGGDTDTNAAIVGAWVGARGGERVLPESLTAELHDGPFGPTHLRALADDLAGSRAGRASRARYSWLAALARNVALYPIVLAHACRVLWSRVLP